MVFVCLSVCYFYANVFFFFFKQKTAYEMRISDWSSDVCSSDLEAGRGGHDLLEIEARRGDLGVQESGVACSLALRSLRRDMLESHKPAAGSSREHGQIGRAAREQTGQDRKSKV